MMTFLSAVSGIVPSAAAFLMTVARQHTGVQIDRPTVRGHPLPTPMVQTPEYSLHISPTKPSEKSGKGRHTGYVVQPKHRTQCLVVANQRCLSKSNATGPYSN